MRNEPVALDSAEYSPPGPPEELEALFSMVESLFDKKTAEDYKARALQSWSTQSSSALALQTLATRSSPDAQDEVNYRQPATQAMAEHAKQVEDEALDAEIWQHYQASFAALKAQLAGNTKPPQLQVKVEKPENLDTAVNSPPGPLADVSYLTELALSQPAAQPMQPMEDHKALALQAMATRSPPDAPGEVQAEAEIDSRQPETQAMAVHALHVEDDGQEALDAEIWQYCQASFAELKAQLTDNAQSSLHDLWEDQQAGSTTSRDDM